jgi:HPt (histidine-containing phosphotransfer) domain-containing protein
MSRVRAFFLEEAAECLETLRSARRGPADPPRLYAAARRLRGNAQLARYRSLAELAGRVEARLKPLARGGESWGEQVAGDLAADLDELERSVQAVRAGRTHQDVRKDMPDDPEADSAAEVPIEELEYSAGDALARALELRAALEDGIVAGDPVGPILDELFDLVRLGLR